MRDSNFQDSEKRNNVIIHYHLYWANPFPRENDRPLAARELLTRAKRSAETSIM